MVSQAEEMDADADPSENEPDKKAKQDSRSEEAENIGKKTAGRKEVGVIFCGLIALP